MAIPTLPTFSAGQILTSSVMNDVSTLGNYQGLFWIKSQTVGTGVASVTVTGAFSSDFNSYKIIYEGGRTSSSAANMQFQFGGITTSNYFTNRIEQVAGTATVLGVTATALPAWIIGRTGNTRMQFSLELSNPNTTNAGTLGACQFTCLDNLLAYGGTASCWLETVAVGSTTSFNFVPSSGTFTGGTIRVYGYRK
jgi:hypothetical protein